MSRYHLIWSTYGSWLPGDPRGFRTKRHKQHVEGDYRNPPPPGAYDGLHAHAKGELKKPPVVIPRDLRAVAGEAAVGQFEKEPAVAHALSVGGQHFHAAVEAPSQDLKKLVGRVKKVSSHRIRHALPGQVWAGGCKIVVVRSEEHWRSVLGYIRDHAPEAWVWVRE